MVQQSKPLEKFFTDYFKVIFKPQTYTNILYLLMSLLSGIFYFVFIVTGLSIGLGLTVVFIGIPILLFMILISKRIMTYERLLVTNYLNMEVPAYKEMDQSSGSLLKKVKDEIIDPMSWKSIIYLLLKLPIGIFNFTVVVTMFSVSIGLLAAPIVYLAVGQGTGVDIYKNDIFNLLAINIPASSKSVIYALIGFFFIFGSMYLSNLLAYVNGKVVNFFYQEW